MAILFLLNYVEQTYSQESRDPYLNPDCSVNPISSVGYSCAINKQVNTISENVADDGNRNI